jgi:hypothetical protein
MAGLRLPSMRTAPAIATSPAVLGPLLQATRIAAPLPFFYCGFSGNGLVGHRRGAAAMTDLSGGIPRNNLRGSFCFRDRGPAPTAEWPGKFKLRHNRIPQSSKYAQRRTDGLADHCGGRGGGWARQLGKDRDQGGAPSDAVALVALQHVGMIAGETAQEVDSARRNLKARLRWRALK